MQMFSSEMPYNRFLPWLLIIVRLAFGSETGAVTGTVSDTDGNPVTGASVLIVGTDCGSMTDRSGHYFIPRLSPGEYTLTARMVGMAPVTVNGVVIVSDRNSTIHIVMEPEAAGTTTITVTGQRNLVLESVPSTIHVVDRKQISTMPVSGLIDVIESQAGVSVHGGEIHIRGGRSGEVEFLLDGTSMRSPVTNSYAASIPVSAIAEASTITGGFEAEYGNALSGVVKMVAREGGDSYQGDVTGFFGDNTAFGTESEDRDVTSALENDNFRSDCVQGTATLGGPEPLTSSLLPSLGIELPGSYHFFSAAEFSRSGYDLRDSRGNWENNWQTSISGLVNLTCQPGSNTGASILARYSYCQSGWDQWAWSQLDQPVYIEGTPYLGSNSDYALPVRFNESWAVTGEVSRLTGRNTVIEASISYSEFSQWNRIRNGTGGYIGEDLTPSAWYAEHFPKRISDSLGFFHSGLHSSLWLDSRSSVISGSLETTTQLNSVFKLKSGITATVYDVYDFSVTANPPSQTWVNIWKADPGAGSAFVQSTANFSGAMILTTGIRADVFNPRTSMTVPDNPVPQRIPAKYQISPRFGINHPISERDVFFATYGRYFQMPSFDKMFSGTNYNLSGDFTIVGNPDLEAVKTIAYEAGIRHRTGALSTLSFSAFYKEITGLVQTSPVASEGSFFMYQNDESYATVQGAELSFLQLPGELFSGSISYTYSIAEGRYSSAVDQFNYLSSGYQVIPMDDNYLDWDQRHKVSADIQARFEEGEGPVLFNVSSGDGGNPSPSGEAHITF
ncbi:hypothetical protein CSA37_01630 [Candidatus Fermentibacteria bacterium]|nr:MAG: hypothetical protein CSA37_01630 [Candidatus Fermentibacteria bacterium]